MGSGSPAGRPGPRPVVRSQRPPGGVEHGGAVQATASKAKTTSTTSPWWTSADSKAAMTVGLFVCNELPMPDTELPPPRVKRMATRGSPTTPIAESPDPRATSLALGRGESTRSTRTAMLSELAPSATDGTPVVANLQRAPRGRRARAHASRNRLPPSRSALVRAG